jgi:hypothetical protein
MSWSQLSMGSIFGPVYLADLRALPKRLRVRAAAMVREIEASPDPDGFFKRRAPAPFKAGTIIAVAQGIAIRYAIDHDGLRFYRVQVIGR